MTPPPSIVLYNLEETVINNDCKSEGSRIAVSNCQIPYPISLLEIHRFPAGYHVVEGLPQVQGYFQVRGSEQPHSKLRSWPFR
jgi:hypothetical protein